MRKNTRKNRSKSSIDDQKRRKREVIIIAVIVAIVALLTLAENRIIHFGADFPISNTILCYSPRLIVRITAAMPTSNIATSHGGHPDDTALDNTM